MRLKEHFQRKVTITVLQGQCLLIITLLSTLCLVSVWPRFRDDALSVDWYVYLIMIALALIPLLKRK